jgi:hemerythrin
MEKEMLVEWDDRYSMGIPLIDSQHRKLIEMTNDLYNACLEGTEAAEDTFRSAIHSMVDYVKYHFAAEEKLMETSKYPGLNAHRREHEGFVLKVLQEVRDFENGKKFIPNIFVRYLKDWILAHIAVEDRKYAEYLFALKRQRNLGSGSLRFQAPVRAKK